MDVIYWFVVSGDKLFPCGILGEKGVKNRRQEEEQNGRTGRSAAALSEKGAQMP